MSIKPLSKKSIDLISSSQAISSISSAIKELVENSLDAQAQNIEVNLIDRGLSLIEVKDDGTGISKEDATFMAWSSYTSKIMDFSDLGSLNTYGFRGQALNAACQISDVTVFTKIKDDEAMRRYLLNNEGEIITSDLIHGLKGTTVQMKSLFKNFPVRKSDMKKRIIQEIKDAEMLLKIYSTCQPSIGFRLKVDKKTIFSKKTCKDVAEAFKTVIGVQIFSKLTCIRKSIGQTELVLIVPKKENIDCSGMSQNGYQFLCVNNRPIKCKEIEKMINKKISEYSSQSTASFRKFIFCLILAVDPSMLDVNLEPNKDKVLLQNMAAILKEIDNLLSNEYGSQDSRVSKQDKVARQVCDMDLDESEQEKEGPPRKKRKLNINNKNISSKYTYTKNKNSITAINKVTDDHKMSSDNSSRKMKNQEGNRIEPMEVQESDGSDLLDIAQDKSIIEDEVLKVDLGEDFDMQEIFSKSKNLLVPDLKETHPDGSASSVSRHIDEVTLNEVQACLQDDVIVSSFFNDKSFNGVDFHEKETGKLSHHINEDTWNEEQSWVQDDDIVSSFFNDESCDGNDFNKKETVGSRQLDTTEMDAYRDWKGISPVDTNQHIQNVPSIASKQTSKNPKSSLNFLSLFSKKAICYSIRVSETEREMNKKRKRNFVDWTMSPRLVGESCRKSAEKPGKSIVGSLSLSSWILNWNLHLFVFKVTELLSKLNIKKYDINKMSAEYVQNIVDRWFNEKNDLRVFHSLGAMKI